jgi:acetylornithine deacetylase
MNHAAVENDLLNYVEQHADRLVQILQDIIRIPSENTPPTGKEVACQQYIAGFLSALQCDTLLYTLDQVPGLAQHPLFMRGRDYTDRPNVGARRKGHGNGRSLLLSGHIDTVPVGSMPWKHDPFGGAVDGNRLFGRGANDMKGGVAMHLFLMECLQNLNLPLAGDVLFESVVDEEFGGVNGTIAGRLKGFNADAAIISEPTFLRICPAQRGGRVAHVLLKSSGGILSKGPASPSVVEQLTFLLTRIKDFADRRRAAAPQHPLYADPTDPVPVSVTRIVTAPWGNKEPIATPEECRVEIYWQAMPGENMDDLDREFLVWIASLADEPGSPLGQPPQVTFPSRSLPGSAISAQEPLVTELTDCAARALNKPVPVVGFEAPCDMYIFHMVTQTPTVLWGPSGGNTHAADEYVEIDSLVDAAKALLVFVHRWCSAR